MITIKKPKVNKKFVVGLLAVLLGFTAYAAENEMIGGNPFKTLSAISVSDGAEARNICFTVPGNGLFWQMKAGRFRGVDEERCSDFKEFLRMEDLAFEQIVCAAEYMLVKNGRYVYAIGETSECIADMETDNFRIYRGHEGPTRAGDRYYAVVLSDAGSQVYSLPVTKDGEADIVATSGGEIVSVVPTSDGGCLLASGNVVYECLDGVIKPYLATDAPVRDFELCATGIHILTDKALMHAGADGMAVVAVGDFNSVFYESGRTYLLNNDGTIQYSDNF